MTKLTHSLQRLAANFSPFLIWGSEIRDVNILKADIFSGITVALVLVPQSMAYAQLAGLPTYYGLYASFLPVMVAAMFGSSRQLATGPVAVVSLLTASALGPIASNGSGEYLAYAVALALMVGLIQLILGLVRLGMMVAFLSHPVVLGFTNAAAIIITTSQLDKIFGVSVDVADHHYETVWRIIVAAIENPHWPTVGMSALALTIMLVLKKYFTRVPGVLIAVVVSTTISWYIGFEGISGRVVGAIPAGLPSFELPTFNFMMLTQLSGIAFTISLIGFMEAISVAKTMAVSTRQRLDSDQELIGQGLANMTASCFQGYAVSGSFSRSAVNFNSGAVTGFSSIVTGVVVAITLLILTPLLYHLPQPTLAAVIMMAVVSLIRIKPLVQIWRSQKHDAVVAAITFILTLLYAPHLETGILVGVLLSLGLYVYRTMSPHISLLARHKDGSLRDAGKYILQQCPTICIIRFEGPLFFANTSYFENKILERVATMPHLRFVIVDAVAINEIDSTGEAMLRELSRILVEQKIEFLFTRIQSDVMETLARTGFAGPGWEDHFFTSRYAALSFAWERLRQSGDFKCPSSTCQMKDLSGCVLQIEPQAPSGFLEKIYGGRI